MVRSTTGHGKGAGVDNVRTSQSYWLARTKSPISEAIYRRVAALLQYPQELFHPGRNAEQINVHIWLLAGAHHSNISYSLSIPKL